MDIEHTDEYVQAIDVNTGELCPVKLFNEPLVSVRPGRGADMLEFSRLADLFDKINVCPIKILKDLKIVLIDCNQWQPEGVAVGLMIKPKDDNTA